MTVPSRASERSPIVERSRQRSAQKQQVIIDAAYRLIARSGADFTTQELIKEAGIAIQTFYRHFAGKDQLILAVIEDMVAARVSLLEAQALAMSDPIERLRHYITAAVRSLHDDERGARFVTAEHSRLQQLFPEEIAHAQQPFADLVERELRAATDAGRTTCADPAGAAWFTMKLVMAVFHHYAFAPRDESVEDVAERLWAFCLTGFGASDPD